MLRLIRYELYKTFLSRSMLVLIVLMLIMAVFMYSFSTKIPPPIEMLVITEEEAESSSEIMALFDDIERIAGENMYYHQDGLYYFIAGLIRERNFIKSSELYDLYHDSPIMDKFKSMMSIIGYSKYGVFEPDAVHIERLSITFKNTFEDPSFLSFFSLIFSCFFFGRDFSNRTYNGAIYLGIKRKHIFLSKLCTFYIFTLTLSLAGLLLALFIFIPGFTILPAKYILRCILFWLCFGIGFTAVNMVFPFIFRDILKSTACCFLFMLILSRLGSLRCYTPFYIDSALWDKTLPVDAAVWTVVRAFAGLSVCASLSCALFHRAELK